VHVFGFIKRIKETNLVKRVIIATKIAIGPREFALFEWRRYWPLNFENAHKNTTENPEKETHQTE